MALIANWQPPAARRWLCSLALIFCSLAQAAPVAEGTKAPGFALPSLAGEGEGEGELIDLSSLRGKVVYVDFWASWCGPCRVSFPLLDEIREELGDRGFEVLAINVDEYREDATNFLDEVPVNYLVVWDKESSMLQTYGVLGMPTGFLIDREGTVRKVHQGFRRNDAEKLRQEVLELLQE